MPDYIETVRNVFLIISWGSGTVLDFARAYTAVKAVQFLRKQ